MSVCVFVCRLPSVGNGESETRSPSTGVDCDLNKQISSAGGENKRETVLRNSIDKTHLMTLFLRSRAIFSDTIWMDDRLIVCAVVIHCGSLIMAMF